MAREPDVAHLDDCIWPRRSQGGPKGPCTPKFLENIVILCFERRFSKQNSVIRLKSNILPPQFFDPQIFGLVTASGSLDIFLTRLL